MQFEFPTAGRIIFGAGKLRQIRAVIPKNGDFLVVTGKSRKRADILLQLLEDTEIKATVFSVTGEPTIQTIRDGVALAKKRNCTRVIAIGGGSVLDAGKAIAAMMKNDGDVLDYIEIIGRGKPLAMVSSYFVAIPTTAGTGSEVTRNAVLASPEHRLKVSLRATWMVPFVALVDPELTYDLPPSITASTGLDALTQLIEPYVCLRANPITDALCVEAIPRVARSLRTACREGTNAAAREDMCMASLFGGLALANAGLGAVHGFAGPIGGMFSAPHGEICAALLADVMKMNVRALTKRMPNSPALKRYHHVARLLTGNEHAGVDDGIEWVRDLVNDLGIPRLASHEIKIKDTDEIVKHALNASSMKANPIALTHEELEEVLEKAL